MEYRVARYYRGKYGYPERYEYCELQAWNSVYERWYNTTTGFLDLEFVRHYCLIKGIKYSEIPHVFIDKEGKVTPCQK